MELCKCDNISKKAYIINNVTICHNCGLPAEDPGLWIRFRNWRIWFNSSVEDKIDNERKRRKLMKVCPFCSSEVEKDKDTGLYHHNNSPKKCNIKSTLFTKEEWESQQCQN